MHETKVTVLSMVGKSIHWFLILTQMSMPRVLPRRRYQPQPSSAANLPSSGGTPPSRAGPTAELRETWHPLFLMTMVAESPEYIPMSCPSGDSTFHCGYEESVREGKVHPHEPFI